MLEGLVGEAGVGQVAELDEEGAAQGLVGEALEHVGEDGFAPVFGRKVLAGAEDFAATYDGRGKHADAFADDSQQLGHYLPVFGGNDEQGAVSGRRLVDVEQLCGMECVSARQRGDVIPGVVCRQSQRHRRQM